MVTLTVPLAPSLPPSDHFQCCRQTSMTIEEKTPSSPPPQMRVARRWEARRWFKLALPNPHPDGRVLATNSYNVEGARHHLHFCGYPNAAGHDFRPQIILTKQNLPLPFSSSSCGDFGLIGKWLSTRPAACPPTWVRPGRTLTDGRSGQA